MSKTQTKPLILSPVWDCLDLLGMRIKLTEGRKITSLLVFQYSNVDFYLFFGTPETPCNTAAFRNKCIKIPAVVQDPYCIIFPKGFFESVDIEAFYAVRANAGVTPDFRIVVTEG